MFMKVSCGKPNAISNQHFGVAFTITTHKFMVMTPSAPRCALGLPRFEVSVGQPLVDGAYVEADALDF